MKILNAQTFPTVVTVVIAPTLRDGRERFPDAVIITPRSRHGARGIRARRIVVLEAMKGHPMTQELYADALPCLRSASPSTLPPAVGLESTEHGGTNDPEGDERPEQDAKCAQRDPQDKNSRKRIHANNRSKART